MSIQAPCAGSLPAPGETTDLLDQAIARVLQRLDRKHPVEERLRAFWAGVASTREFGATDVVTAEFLALAVASGLRADLGHHTGKDLAHLIRWGLLDRDPFGKPARPTERKVAR